MSGGFFTVIVARTRSLARGQLMLQKRTKMWKKRGGRSIERKRRSPLSHYWVAQVDSPVRAKKVTSSFEAGTTREDTSRNIALQSESWTLYGYNDEASRGGTARSGIFASYFFDLPYFVYEFNFYA